MADTERTTRAAPFGLTAHPVSMSVAWPAAACRGRSRSGLFGRGCRLLVSLGVAFVIAGTASNPATAQRRTAPASQEAVQQSFAPIVRTAAPAVVNVYVRHRVQAFNSPFMDDPLFRRFFGERFGAPQERMQNSLGSGVIVSRDGIIVTNTHVVKGGGVAEIRVALADKREYDAKIVLADEKSDIAVLRIEKPDRDFPTLEFADSDRLEVGDIVLAIGNPFGVGQTVTQGIVSALARTEIGSSDSQVFIQTDAAINPGNSGGALVDVNGRLVGINTAIFSRSGGSHGIGFAIPANLVRLYVDSAVSGRKLERPWLGARLTAVTREVAEALGIERVAGALVERVHADGPAARAGLAAGDVIVRIDGHEVGDARAALYRLTTRGIGNRARLDVLRRGRSVSLEVALTAPPQLRDRDLRNLSGQHPFDGARVANLLPGIAEEMGLGVDEGVVILSVRNGSISQNVGFRTGDIIVQVGRQKVESVEQLERLLAIRQRVWLIAIRRGDRVLQLQLQG
jgi:Do/DeqQ family serine protease